MKSAKYAPWDSSWSTDDKYSTKNLVYDLNGNIKTMVQNFNGSLADSLTYTYKGNILLGVNDLVNNSISTNDFEDNSVKLNPIEGTPSSYEYLYDGNGNMIQDKNKNITVTYNLMNTPTKVYFGKEYSIVGIYTVSGGKLRISGNLSHEHAKNISPRRKSAKKMQYNIFAALREEICNTSTRSMTIWEICAPCSPTLILTGRPNLLQYSQHRLRTCVSGLTYNN